MGRPNWSDLLGELLQRISSPPHIPNIADYIRFSVVNTSWRSTLIDNKPKQLPHHIPLLMFPQDQRFVSHYSFLNLSNNNVHMLLDWTPEPAEYCCGPSHGWMVIVNRKSKDVYLVNPLAVSSQWVLPSLASLRDRTRTIEKAVLSLHPSLDNVGSCVVMAIVDFFKKELGFCKMGDGVWTRIEKQQPPYKDVTFCNGQFYVLDSSNRVYVVCDVSSSSPKLKQISDSKIFDGDYVHLVEVSGDLLLVTVDPKVPIVEVYKLDFCSGRWLEVTSLDGHILFLSGKSCFSVLASNYSGLKMDCVYFVYSRSGIFNLRDGSCELLPLDVYTHKCYWPCEAFWITPSLW